MSKIGIDLCDRTPQLLARELAKPADLVITVGCRDTCPFIPGKRYLDRNLPDPPADYLPTFAAIRDEIDTLIQALITELDTDTTRVELDTP